jgi:hypothetical protein
VLVKRANIEDLASRVDMPDLKMGVNQDYGRDARTIELPFEQIDGFEVTLDFNFYGGQVYCMAIGCGPEMQPFRVANVDYFGQLKQYVVFNGAM